MLNATTFTSFAAASNGSASLAARVDSRLPFHARTTEAPRQGNLRHVLPFEEPVRKLEQQIVELEALQVHKQADYTKELRSLRNTYTDILRKTYENLSAWETVQVARHPARPLFRDYIEMICREFREIHGDRMFGDDKAMLCGLARIGGHKVMLIGHHKGKDTKEKVACYFGLAHPEGYRKALRAMKLAEKFRLPVVCLVDTPGAYPGIGCLPAVSTGTAMRPSAS